MSRSRPAGATTPSMRLEDSADSTIATLRTESKSLGFTALAVAWPLALAWAASFAFYQGMRALGY